MSTVSGLRTIRPLNLIRQVKFTATTTSAALAGLFSALAWPLLWSLFGDESSSSSLWLVLGTIAFVALPAHAFVVGFKRSQTAGSSSVDAALLKRLAAWILSAAATTALVSLYRAQG